MRTIRRFTLILGVLLAVCLLALGIKAVKTFLANYDPYNYAGARRMNDHMAKLRDRARGNPRDANALAELIRSLDSDDSFERTEAAGFLGQVGPAAKDAVDPLVRTLDGADPFAATAAARALGEIGPTASAAIPALMRAAQMHQNDSIGWSAANSLGTVADPEDQGVIRLLRQESASRIQLMRSTAEIALNHLMARRSNLDTRDSNQSTQPFEKW